MTRETRTGGRAATTAVVPGEWALSVGKPELPEPVRFRWTPLSEVARLESGHTPSRSRAEYWNDGIPWIGIRDASGNHGRVITDTEQHVSQAGLDNSSARLLPAGTVCLSRTASVGFVVMMGRPMATSQDFVNWVCGPKLNPHYLRYVLMLEQESIRRFAYGSVHPTMYYPDAKALHALLPSREDQDAAVDVLGALDDKIASNTAVAAHASGLAILLAGSSSAAVVLNELAAMNRKTAMPSVSVAGDPVAHYSIPAFDEGQLPAAEDPGEIKSAKFHLTSECVLVSKLNPRFPRVWAVDQVVGLPGWASTEFIPLAPRGVSVGALWAAVAQPSVALALSAQVAGTSGSHQRVKPDDIMQVQVPDVRTLPTETFATINNLVRRAQLARVENRTLAALRDTLLPQLMSGKLRVKDAERQVSEAT